MQQPQETFEAEGTEEISEEAETAGEATETSERGEEVDAAENIK